MEITLLYIWSQIFTLIEYGLLGLSYLAKKRKVIVLLDIISMVAGIVAFLLLGADLGMAMSVVILLANFYYLWDANQHGRSNKYFVRDYVVLVVTMVAIGVLAVLTYDGVLSLLSVAATVLYEISIWQKRPKMYKLLGIPVALCWVLYNGFVRSIFGVLCELIVLIMSIVGYVLTLRKTKRKTARR